MTDPLMNPLANPTGDQLSLFSATQAWQIQGRPIEGFATEIGEAALVDWKQRLFDQQQQTRFLPRPQQASLSLFEESAPYGATPENPAPDPTDPDQINPFALEPKNINFWQWPVQEAGVAALYFVIDYELPLLLYIGETVKSNQRWKGVHDCKRYLANYRQAHYQNRLTTQLGIAFWCKAPVDTRSRQKLEAALIHKWRSPFNKENWVRCGTPFVGGKVKDA
jgi:hypothetical protein